MVEGGSDQAHRPGHVPENLRPKKLDGLTEPRLNSPLRTDSFAEVMEHDGEGWLAVSWSSSKWQSPRVGQALFGGCGGGERS